MFKAWDAFRKRLSAHLAPHGAVSEFSRKTGISRATLDNWLDEEKPTAPTLEFLDKVAEGMGMDPRVLISPPVEKPSAKQILLRSILGGGQVQPFGAATQAKLDRVLAEIRDLKTQSVVQPTPAAIAKALRPFLAPNDFEKVAALLKTLSNGKLDLQCPNEFNQAKD